MGTTDHRSLGADAGLHTLRIRSRARLNLQPIVWGQAISLFGDYIAYFTLPLFVVFLTGRPRDLGLVAAAETIPMILFGFAAGVFLDRRRNLKRTLMASDGIRAIAFVILAFATAVGVAEPWMVFGIAFIVGTVKVVFDSGLQAMMPSVLEDDMLIDANSRLAFALTMAMTFGPLAAGLIVALSGGFSVAFLLNAATFVASASFLLWVRQIRPRPRLEKTDFRQSLSAGLRFLSREPHLRWGTLGGTVTNLVFAPLEALLVLYVIEFVELPQVSGPFEWAFRDEAAIGLFFALQALVASIGVPLAPRLAKRIPLGRLYIGGLALFGMGFLAVTFTQSFWVVLATGVGVAGVMWVNISLATLRQQLTPPELLGRVITASRTVAWLGLPVGAALGGYLAEVIGVVEVYAIGAFGVLLVAAALVLTPLWSDRIMASDTHETPSPVGSGDTSPVERSELEA